MSYRVYVTDTLMLAGTNRYIDKRWIETIYLQPEDGRTGDEIAAEVIKRAGLRLKGGETSERV